MDSGVRKYCKRLNLWSGPDVYIIKHGNLFDMSAEFAQAIRLAQSGNRQAFHLLYREHIGRVYAVCWRLLGDRQKAEDACQEVFIKVWQSLSTYRGDSNFSTWLRSIATRTVIDL